MTASLSARAVDRLPAAHRAVHQIVDLARRRGWDTGQLLAEAGIAPQLLNPGRARVTVGQAVHLVQRLWRSTDDELLGLGRHPMPRGAFRLVCFALLGSRDIAAKCMNALTVSITG
ncbi:AraC family transcriptional regulator ligand-binding domain-containing protein [Nocardia nova]|uniref:AraC family transcriptional regulator ligand-binding domain-containing protein n=1 Tax=Nocardia nova TaxID=37330 RepID=UPI0015E303DC|nr:AraC family transcriptional regulator ligand-binding domain-containing protein [Nocardia nova]